MKLFRWFAILAALAAAAPGRADLAAARAEPNLEKRSRKALDNAAAALTAAEKAYRQGDLKHTQVLLAEVRESVELAHESLQQTGKNPSRSPKHFKHAEIKTRELVRRMGDLREHMAIDDREVVDQVRARVREIHDELLRGIMGKRR
ncbi:MAG: hypothetical protein AAB225_32015 [Acidobacteriota bacterium]